MRFRVMEKLEEISEALRNAGSGESAEKHLARCAKIAALAFIASWLLWNLFSEDFFGGMLFSLACSITAFFFLLYRPKLLLRKKASQVEKHLPFALMQLSVELNIGVPFDRALERVANSDYGELSKVLGKALKHCTKSGLSIPEALREAGRESGSKQFRRSAAQITAIYSHGTVKNPGEIIRRIALEQLSRQKSEAKEFSGKIAVVSLAFIAVSAIMPALFQAFTIVGSSFIEMPLTGIEVLLVIAVLFPLADAAMLLYIKSITPEFLKG
ncbi:MAG TPA: type II secretion system F family protein [archaeon]|nr:type II secretion system F family protein [archaeon]